MSLDRETLEAYQRRWQAVEQVEKTERRTATVEERWRRLNSLLRMADTLGLHPEDGAIQPDPAHQRWNQLRTLYLAERGETSL